MKNLGFDNNKYLKLQVEKISERIERFGDKLYLEFGGKIFDDYHASRSLPGFESDAKIKTLTSLKDRLEVIIVISAGDIQNGKMRSDLGLSYDEDVIRLIEIFNDANLYVSSVVITQYARQAIVDMFKTRLENRGVKVYLHYPISGYPTNLELILSPNGFGKNDYIETSRPLVVITAPGSGSGKMATCLSQLYHENARGIRAGYAKFETFPIWNLPLNHPVNLAYEAATADIKDLLMVDPFHLEAYRQVAINYNRDIEVFPILQAIFKRIYGHSPYLSPTDMGINTAGECIINDEVTRKASKQEIIRRYLDARCDLKNGLISEETVDKLSFIMNQVGVNVSDRLCVEAALNRMKESGTPSMAIELVDGTVITGKTTSLLDASAATIINALKYYARIDKDLKLISPFVIEPIQALKANYLGNSNQRLHVYEVLIALSMNAMTNPAAEKALQQLPKLARAQAHSTIMLTSDDQKILKKLEINTTSEPMLRRIKHTNL